MSWVNTLIVSFFISLIILGTVFAIWSDEISQTPYEQCVNLCNDYGSNPESCLGRCNEDFERALGTLLDKATPLLKEVIDSQRCIND